MRIALKRAGALGIAWGVTTLPSLASACAVCTAGRDEENAFAFLMTTLFMSIMPLAAIGSLVYFLWRRIQKLEAERGEAVEGRNASATPASASAAMPKAPTPTPTPSTAR